MERLFIMRHAIAEDRDEFRKTGQPDEKRPLTRDGISKLKRIAKALAKLDLNITTIVQSPLTRSQQTAEILAKHLKGARVVTLESLRPESELMDLVRGLNELEEGPVLIVGHEDHLSRFTKFLLTGDEYLDFLHFKKAGLASLIYDDHLVPSDAELEWLLTPKMILGLAEV